jgi:predicted permease
MPDWGDHIRRQLAGLRLPPEREAEIVEELEDHAEDRYREYCRNGMADTEARRLALDEIAGHELLAAELRTAEPRRRSLFYGLPFDLRYSLRTLRRNPAVTAIAVLALSLGIGANTAIFTVINSVLLRPLTYPHPERLVMLYESGKDFSHSSVSYPNFLDWRRLSRSFTEMGAYRSDDFNWTGSGEPEHLSGQYVSAGFFPATGIAPALGRIFLPEDDRPGAACTVMLSNGLWQRRFAGAADVLGRHVTLNATDCTVVGVLPAAFHLGWNAEVYVPIELWKSVELHDRNTRPGLRVVGRLKEHATADGAQGELNAIAAELSRQYPASNGGRGIKVSPAKDDIVGGFRPTLLLLAGAVGFVLIIACANVANLLLARAAARKREFALRSALGAERSRIVRQLLTESTVLSLAGAAGGLALAWAGVPLVLAAAPGTVPRAAEIGIDPYVLLFTAAVSILTGIVFGLVPAFHGANSNPQESLKEGTRGAGGGRHRTEGIFVAVEMGLAVTLVVGAGLMMQSVWRLLRVDPGFQTHGLLTARVAVSPTAMSNPTAIRSAFLRMVDRVAEIPGVQAAAITSLIPLGDSDSEIGYWTGGGPQPSRDDLTSAMFYIVTPGYRSALDFPLRRGRFFTDRDDLSAPPVVVIDDVMARHVFGAQDPVGKQFDLLVIGRVEVVGVVGHVKHWGLDESDNAKLRDQVYFPFGQVPLRFMSEAVGGLTLAIRTASDSSGFLPSVRAAVAGPTLDQPVYHALTMEQIISASLADRRFTLLLLAIFAGIALLLAAVGIYGVMSYAVTRRTHEMGIRAALGSSRREIVWLVLRQGMKPAGAGMIAGLAAAAVLTRFMAGMLFGVQPADPMTLAAVALLLGGVAVLACYIPARRATAIDPVIALRCE